jgi:hypothetical protein
MVGRLALARGCWQRKVMKENAKASRQRPTEYKQKTRKTDSTKEKKRHNSAAWPAHTKAAADNENQQKKNMDWVRLISSGEKAREREWAWHGRRGGGATHSCWQKEKKKKPFYVANLDGGESEKKACFGDG